MHLVKITCHAAWISRSVMLGCKLVQVPLLLSLLEVKEYALWVVLASLEAWFFLLDFGIGLSIQNSLVEASLQEGEKQRSLVKTAFLFSCLALVFGVCLFSLAYPHLSTWIVQGEGKEALWMAGFFFLLGTFSTVGGRVLIARQKGGVVYVVQAISSMISLGALWSISQKTVHLKEAVLATFGVQSLISCSLAYMAFASIDWKAKMCWSLLYKRARQFWVFSCLAAVVLSSDAWILSKTLSDQGIVEYHFLCKLFALPSALYSSLLQGLWPFCSMRWASHEGKWVEEKVLFCSILGVGMAFLFTGAVLLLKDPLKTFVPFSLSGTAIVWGGLYLSVRIVADFYAMALQSRSELKPFFVWVPIQAVISLSLQWVLSLSWGASGIFAGITFSYLATMCWVLPRSLSQSRLRAGV